MFPERPEQDAGTQKLLQSPFGNNASLFEEIDVVVEMPQQVQAMQRGDHGLVPEFVKEFLVDHQFSAGGHAAGGLIEQHDI